MNQPNPKFWQNCVIRDLSGMEYMVAGTPDTHCLMTDKTPVYALKEHYYRPEGKTWIVPQALVESDQFVLVDKGPYGDIYEKPLK